MNMFSFIKVEVSRLFHSKITYLVMILSLLSPFVGYSFYQPAVTDTKAAIYLANPVLAGTIGAGILFGLFTLYELNRIHKEQTDVITDTILSPVTLYVARISAIIVMSIVTILLIMVIYLPYTMVKMENIFEFFLYIACFLIIMMPAMWIGALLVSFFYQLTRRVELSLILFTVSIIICFTSYFSDEFLLRWINPIVPILSDDFSNSFALLTVLYNRIFWMISLTALFVFSTLFVRMYGKTLLGSFGHSIRKAYIPIITTALLCSGFGIYQNQPFYNHAPADVWDRESTANEKAFLVSTHVDAVPNVKTHTQRGTATYEIINRNKDAIDQFLLINPGYKIQSFTINGKPADYVDLDNHIVRYTQIKFSLPPEDKITVEVKYSGFPMAWSIAKGSMGGDEVDKKYIYLIRTGFAPVMDMIPYKDAPKTTANIILPDTMNPVTRGGTITFKQENGDGTKTWFAENTDDNICLYAADYISEKIVGNDMTMELYYSKKHKEVMEVLDINETVKGVLDYCIEHYGPIIFADETGSLKLVQLTAFMFGGNAANGVSVMGESSFSAESLSNPLSGPNSQETMAHEIVHQWWGLGVMFQDDYFGEWSSEGFTVYTTYRMMKEKYGASYAKKHYIDVWQKNVDQQDRDFYSRHPEYIDILPEKYSQEIAGNKSSVNWYCRMPLKILKAAQLVGGEDKLDRIMSKLFQEKSGNVLTYEDFLTACNLTKEDLELD